MTEAQTTVLVQSILARSHATTGKAVFVDAVILRGLIAKALQGAGTCGTCRHLQTSRDITDEARSYCPVQRIDVTEATEDFGCPRHAPEVTHAGETQCP